MANGQIQPQNGQTQPQQGQQPPEPPSTHAIEGALRSPTEVGYGYIPQIPLDAETKNEPYIWPAGLSHPDRWTQDSARLEAIRNFKGVAPAPWAPQIHEVQDIVGRAGRFFVQNGSRPQAMRAGRMLAYNDKYWKDYLAGKHTLALMDHQQYVFEQEQFTNNQRKEFALLQDVYQTYKDNPTKFNQEIQNLSRRFDDPRLIEWANQGIQTVMENVSNRVNYNEALLHTKQQRLNAEKTELDNQRAKEEMQADAEYLAGTSPPGSPTAPDRVAGTSGPRVPETDATHGIPQNSAFVRDVQNYQLTGKLPPELARRSPRVLNALGHAKEEMDNYYQSLIDPNNPLIPANPTDEQRAQALALIRAKNPGMANRVAALLSGAEQLTPTKSTEPGFELAIGLANRLQPGWSLNAAKNQERAQLLERRYQLMAQRPVIAAELNNIDMLNSTIPRNVADMDSLIQISRDMGGSFVPFIDRWHRYLRKEIAGDTQVVAFDQLVERMKADVAQITRTFGGRGVYTVNAQRAMERLIDAGANPNMLRSQADTLRREYENLVVPAYDTYNRRVGRAFPGAGMEESADDLLTVLRSGREEDPPVPEGARKLRD